MRAILLLALKDQKLLFRDKGGLFWTFGFPLIFAALFGAMFSGVFNASSGSGIAMAIAIVDQEPSAESRSFVERLDANPSVLVDHMSLADAERAVRLRRKTAYLILAAPTTAAPGLKFTIGIDPSRQAASGMLRGILMGATLADSFPGSAVTNSAPDIPGAPRIDVVDVTRKARTRDRVTSAYQITFPSAILWGMMGCVAGFAVSFVRERTRGTHLRLVISPLSQFATVAGKSLSCLISALLVATFLLVFAALVFGLEIESPGLLSLAVFSTAFCFTGLMMLLGSLAKSEEAVNGAGWGVMTILAMLGGGMMPLIFFPKWLVPVSHVSPVKWGIYSLEGAIWRGFNALDMLMPIAILLGVGLLGFGLAMLVQRKAEF